MDIDQEQEQGQITNAEEDENSMHSENNINEDNKEQDSEVNRSQHYSSEQTNSSESKSKDQQKKKRIFPFEIFLDNEQLQIISPDQERIFNKIQSDFQVEKIFLDHDLQIPDLSGVNLKIYDSDMKKKYNSCLSLLKHIHQNMSKQSDYKQKGEIFGIIILVPEGMVSLMIGSRGRQINKIMKDSNTKIIVNQPINKMTYRTVKIEGKYECIASACQIIYKILEERSPIAYEIEKIPKPIDIAKVKVKAKFVFSRSLSSFLCNKKSFLLNKLESELNTQLKFKDDFNSKCLKTDEEICIIQGNLEDVQSTIVLLLRIIEEYYTKEKNKPDYIIKLLIPNNYVTKLIGAKGCMIRELAAKAGGATIKILSDKQSERELQECIISVAGSLANKQDACCLILEQIECFKNGGPILLSGKNINDNLALQYRNSVPIRSEENSPTANNQKFGGDENAFQKDDRRDQDYNKKLRSRSRSHSQSHSHSKSRSRSRSRSNRSKKQKRSKHYGFDKDQSGRPQRTYSQEYKNDQDKRSYHKRQSRDRNHDNKEGGRVPQYYQVDKERNLRMHDHPKEFPQFYDKSPKDKLKRYSHEKSSDKSQPILIDQKYDRESNEKEMTINKGSKDEINKDIEKQELKIPVLIPSKLAAALTQDDQQLLKNITKGSGCKLYIQQQDGNTENKQKKIILQGTIEENTRGFKQLQREYLFLGINGNNNQQQ